MKQKRNQNVEQYKNTNTKQNTKKKSTVSNNVIKKSNTKTNVKKPENKVEQVKTEILNLFYMSTNTITAKNIYEVIQNNDNIECELWNEMNILQLELENKNTVEFELIEHGFTDVSDQAFIKNRQIHTIFSVTLEENDFIKLNSIFLKIINELDGFLCTDSIDFKPIYSAENLL